jgi:hypothetical protein
MCAGSAHGSFPTWRDVGNKSGICFKADVSRDALFNRSGIILLCLL